MAVRVLARQQLILKRPDIWRPDTALGYAHQPSVHTSVNTGERTVTFISDSMGFRVGHAGRLQGEQTILLLGDSFVEALQVEYEQSLAGLLEERLSQVRRHGVAVRNAGVGGWDPDQYLIRAREVIGSEPFSAVVTALYVENDAISYWRQSVPARTPEEVHALRLPRRLSVSELKDALFYPVNDFLEVRSHLFVLLKNRLQGVRMRLGLTAVSFPWVYQRSEAASSRWENTATICAAIAGLARERRMPALFLLIPAPYQVDRAVFDEYVRGFGIDTTKIDLDQPSRLLYGALQRQGLNVIDALGPFRQAADSGAPLYGRVDNHLSPRGHDVLAGIVSPELTRLLQANKTTRR